MLILTPKPSRIKAKWLGLQQLYLPRSEFLVLITQLLCAPALTCDFSRWQKYGYRSCKIARRSFTHFFFPFRPSILFLSAMIMVVVLLAKKKTLSMEMKGKYSSRRTGTCTFSNIPVFV